ncbi:hypothetical protein AeRB84_005467 [Aphanomyces euteiches]|nr:hypothetical protein AeRB84_007738 [Aphanomyces euteiches]KAH9149079.1 hypothetical protein AeRB84_007775 [Aphanomyces euteiches]KAH9152044.1 hypothetical protein AeRB84_005467 [Aphanomyces euteiches]
MDLTHSLASILPGSYVALASDTQVWLRRTMIDPELPTHVVSGRFHLQKSPQDTRLMMYPLANRYIPTVEYIHLEMFESSACRYGDQKIPPQPSISMLVGAIIQDGMLWHCVWYGVDYGAWRCRLGSMPDVRSMFEQIPTTIQNQLGRFGAISSTTRLTVSHDRSCTFRIETPAFTTSFVPNRTSQTLNEMASIHLMASSNEAVLSSSTPTGICSILIYGPVSSGKSALVQDLARRNQATLLKMDASIISLQTGAPLEQHFLDCFSAALHMQPAVIFIDNLELLFPKSHQGPGSDRLSDFCSAMIALCNEAQQARVVVVGTVVEMDHLHPKVRQCFTDELAMETTALPFRRELLMSLFSSSKENSSPSKQAIDALLVQGGQLPGDITSIVRQAVTSLVVEDGKGSSPTMSLENVVAAATSSARQSKRSSVVTTPSVTWNDIGGAEELKQYLKEMVVWPFEKPDVLARMGISPPVGLLLHGPPGTGKTMLAKAAANATMCNFMNVTASDLMSSEFGESEKAVTQMFQTAKAMSPCIVFLDEFQSLFATRSSSSIGSRMASQLLQEIDALKTLSSSEQYVFILAATNCRFEHILYVGYPDAAGRLKILKLMQSQMPWDSDVDLEDLVQDMDGLSSAEIVSVIRIAALISLERNEVKHMYLRFNLNRILKIDQDIHG